MKQNIPSKPARRLTPEQRKQDIVAKAIEYFSEVGFDGSTRELAQRVGITQPLLYRYFPTKDALISQVYQSVYLERWQPEWEAMLADRNRPLQDRLQIFYEEYTDAIFGPDWIRIYLFSGLRGFDMNKWYVKLVEKQLLRRICLEYRHDLGISSNKRRITSMELETTWTLHGGIFYYGVRKHIYGLPVARDKKKIIANAIEVFFRGGEKIFRKASK